MSDFEMRADLTAYQIQIAQLDLKDESEEAARDLCARMAKKMADSSGDLERYFFKALTKIANGEDSAKALNIKRGRRGRPRTGYRRRTQIFWAVWLLELEGKAGSRKEAAAILEESGFGLTKEAILSQLDSEPPGSE